MFTGSALFWGITQRRVVVPYRRLGTTYRSHLQGLRSPRPLKMGPIRCPETPVKDYHSTLRNITEQLSSQPQRTWLTKQDAEWVVCRMRLAPSVRSTCLCDKVWIICYKGAVSLVRLNDNLMLAVIGAYLLATPVREGVAFTVFYSRHPKVGCHFADDAGGPLFAPFARFPRINWLSYCDNCGASVRLWEVSCFEVCETLLHESRVVNILEDKYSKTGVASYVLLGRGVVLFRHDRWSQAIGHILFSLCPFYRTFNEKG
jgi:hypothetical protein